VRFAAALIAALVLAGAASAAIVVGRGIGGVTIGMSRPAVRAKLGKPAKVVHATNEFGPYTQFRYVGYTVNFQNNGTVTSIETTLARERTAPGVGVGSTWGQVKTKVPGVFCEGSPELGHCHVGRLLPGRTVTDFFFRKSHVQSVLVGVVLD
jgi:hypothetical protein